MSKFEGEQCKTTIEIQSNEYSSTQDTFQQNKKWITFRGLYSKVICIQK